jgi:Tol biopolymer transport system component
MAGNLLVRLAMSPYGNSTGWSRMAAMHRWRLIIIGLMLGASTACDSPTAARQEVRLLFANRDNPGLPGPGIGVGNLDGTGLRRLTSWGAHPRWLADGNGIVYHSNELGMLHLFTLDLNGLSRPLLVDSMFTDHFGVPAPTGDWIYFSGIHWRIIGSAIWRFNLRTRALEQLTSAASINESRNRVFDVSQDGLQVLFENFSQNRQWLAVLTVATKQFVEIAETCHAALWSPRPNESIACMRGKDNELQLLRADGTLVRSLGTFPTAESSQAMGWSEGGDSLLAAQRDGIYIIDAVSGQSRRLTWSTGLYDPSLRVH